MVGGGIRKLRSVMTLLAGGEGSSQGGGGGRAQTEGGGRAQGGGGGRRRGRAQGGGAQDGGGAQGGGGGRRRRGRREPTPPPQDDDHEFVAATEEDEEEEETREEIAEAVEEARREDASERVEREEDADLVAEENGVPTVWLRGSSRLPDLPIQRRPVIRPSGTKDWEMVIPGSHSRRVNGILGLLCRANYPGMVRIDGVVQPAMKWSHWHAASDQTDRAGRCYNSKADRVMKELWDYYTLAEGVRREDADDVVYRVCVHRVQDLFYETKLLCRRIYHARRGNRVTRAQAVHLPLTKEQYLTVPPAWCAGMDNCWEAIVDTWLSEEYEQYHAVRSRCRAMMQGSSHKQGPTTLKEYAARYTRFHPGQECASFKAYALAHKGKAKDPDLVYNPEDPPEAYSNLSVHSRLSEYTAMAREIHGPEFDPSTADLEGDIVMRLGPGKPHGRYYMGNSTIDTANTQTLAQIRARSTSSSPTIRPRSQPQVVALQAQIEALQESQQASQSQFQALQLSHQAELAQERARVQAQLEAFQQSQKAWYEYMASFSQSMGQPPPPPPPPMIPLVPPPPRDGTPGPSTAGSNNDQDLDLSPFLGRAPTM